MNILGGIKLISTLFPIPLRAPRPLDEHLMLRALHGVFCAGEMLDWEAPYLIQPCLATGRAAGLRALEWLKQREN